MRLIRLGTILFGIVAASPFLPFTPTAAASDGFPAGYLYLATQSGVIELDPTGATTRTLNVGGEAFGVAFAPNGNLYVTVQDQDEIVEVAPDGTIVMTISSVLFQVFGVCVGPEGRIYSTAWGDSDVNVFDRNGNSMGSINGALSGGAGLTMGPGGNLFVCSSNADELVEYAPDGTVLGALATGATVQGPRDVLLTAHGTMLLGTWTSNTLFQTDLDGVVLNSDVSVSAPQAMAMGADGYLYVGDVQVVKRFQVTESGFTYVDEFAAPSVGVGSIYDMAFAPQRMQVKLSGRVVGSGVSEKISENATLSLCADGYQLMLMPDPQGTLTAYMPPFVGYGPELHAAVSADSKRTFLASQVIGDAAQNGVSTLWLEGKGYPDLDDRFFTKKVAGSFTWWSQGVTFSGKVKGKKTLN